MDEEGDGRESGQRLKCTQGARKYFWAGVKECLLRLDTEFTGWHALEIGQGKWPQMLPSGPRTSAHTMEPWC